MFPKVLCPTDFSSVSAQAFSHMGHLRKAGTREVVLLHVIDSRFFDFMFYDTQKSLDAETKLIEQAREKLEHKIRFIKDMGFAVKGRIETGFPSREILRVEEEEGVSLILIGSHGKSNIEGVLLGSVSEEVVRKAKGPVLVIKR
ncbi:MAG TPA: universal stress protein [Deltaproteobacteria bacterium]|nr:universal stress protein [Desulfomonilia bacterium]HDP24857.1 universal stress protein [Deltaproteobacteria bacterium]